MRQAMDVGQQFGAAVRLFRESLNLSQRDVEGKTGLPKGTLAVWETGRIHHIPTHEALPRLFALFEVEGAEDLIVRFHRMLDARGGDGRLRQIEERLERMEYLLRPREAGSPTPHLRWPMHPYLDEGNAVGRAIAGGDSAGEWYEPEATQARRELPYVVLAPDATCLEPYLEPGDRVLFDPDQRARDGYAVVAYLPDDNIVAVKVYERHGDEVTLRGLDDTKTEPITRHYSRVQIEGVVVDRVQRVRLGQR